MEETDTTEQLIRAFQEYFKWNDRFEYKESDDAGIKARNALHDIRKLAFTRRQEIQDKRRDRGTIKTELIKGRKK
jgi:hypothetical protein